MVLLRCLLVIAIIALAIARFRVDYRSITSPGMYGNSDILIEYLMSKAIVAGINPYLSLNELAKIFIGLDYYHQPSPYPPFTAILFIPISFLSYQGAVIFWFIFEISCLFLISLLIIYYIAGKIKWIWAICSFIILLAWEPVMEDLLYGPLSVLFTTLLLITLLLWRRGRKSLAGIIIGLTVSIKLFTWPLVIYFALKREWRTVIASICTGLVFNLIALSVIGFDPIKNYLNYAAQELNLWQAVIRNFSLWSVGYRLFSGTSSTILKYSFQSPPIIDMPDIARYVSLICVITFLFISLIWAKRLQYFDISFAIMTCVIVIISPIAWNHYYVITAIALAVTGLYLAKLSFPKKQTLGFIILVFFVFIGNSLMNKIVILLNGGNDAIIANNFQISFTSSLIYFLPMLEIIALTIILWQIGSYTNVHLQDHNVIAAENN